MTQDLFSSVDAYIDGLFAPSDDVLLAVIQSLDEAKMPQISVSPNQGKFLYMMAHLCHAKSILELGTLGGYSTIWLGRSLPPDGRLISMELNPDYAAIAQKNIDRAGLISNVEIRVGNALDLLAQLESENPDPFDMVFMDADKPPYVEYFQAALRMTRPGGLIVADNVVRDGNVIDADSSDEKVQGVRRFNAMLANNDAVTATVLQTVGAKGYDGMALAVVNR